jgi:hypothetical protein
MIRKRAAPSPPGGRPARKKSPHPLRDENLSRGTTLLTGSLITCICLSLAYGRVTVSSRRFLPGLGSSLPLHFFWPLSQPLERPLWRRAAAYSFLHRSMLFSIIRIIKLFAEACQLSCSIRAIRLITTLQTASTGTATIRPMMPPAASPASRAMMIRSGCR